MEDIQKEDVEQIESTQLSFGQTDDTQDTSEAGQVTESFGNWNDDKRFSEHWGEDPNKMYESLKYAEKKQGDYDSQVNDYKSQIDTLNQYKTDYEEMDRICSQPGVGEEILGVIERYQQNKNQQPQVNQQQQQQQQGYQGLDPAIQNQLNSVLEWKGNLESRADKIYAKEQEDNQLGQIDEYAKKYNIQYKPEEFKKFVTEGNVPTESWVHYFKSHAADVAMKNTANKAAENAYRNKSLIPSSVSGLDKNGPTLSGESVDDALTRILG
ncbi:hypothetical protein CL622_07390 [archaeon]|nr:hypothetical protein [archaeon]